MLQNDFYFCFILICYFNITRFTAFSDVSKGPARYWGNCWYSLASLLVYCEHANKLDRTKKKNKNKSRGSVVEV